MFKSILHHSGITEERIMQVKDLIADLNKSKVEQISQIIDKSIYNSNKDVFYQLDINNSFTCSSVRIPRFVNEMSPIYSILSNVLENEFLFHMVRVELGAYGVWAITKSEAGVLTLISYRDSNPGIVLKKFKEAVAKVANGEIDDEMIERAKIKQFSHLDYPISPSIMGNLEYLGITKELSQSRRSIFYHCTKEQVIEAAKEVQKSEWRSGTISNTSLGEIPEGLHLVNTFNE